MRAVDATKIMRQLIDEGVYRAITLPSDDFARQVAIMQVVDSFAAS